MLRIHGGDATAIRIARSDLPDDQRHVIVLASFGSYSHTEIAAMLRIPTVTVKGRMLQARVIGSSGSAEVRRASGHTELVVHHLAPPPSGEIYEAAPGS